MSMLVGAYYLMAVPRAFSARRSFSLVGVTASDCALSPGRRPQLGQSRSGDRATGDREGEPYTVVLGMRKGRPVWRKLSGRPDAIQDAEGADDHKRRTHQAGVPPVIPNFLLLIVSEESRKISMPIGR
jgi:hypothetical protein